MGLTGESPFGYRVSPRLHLSRPSRRTSAAGPLSHPPPRCFHCTKLANLHCFCAAACPTVCGAAAATLLPLSVGVAFVPEHYLVLGDGGGDEQKSSKKRSTRRRRGRHTPSPSLDVQVTATLETAGASSVLIAR